MAEGVGVTVTILEQSTNRNDICLPTGETYLVTGVAVLVMVMAGFVVVLIKVEVGPVTVLVEDMVRVVVTTGRVIVVVVVRVTEAVIGREVHVTIVLAMSGTAGRSKKLL